MRFSSDDYQALQGMAASGIGVALIPTMALASSRSDVVVLPLRGRAPSRQILAAVRTGEQDPLVEHFVESLRRGRAGARGRAYARGGRVSLRLRARRRSRPRDGRRRPRRARRGSARRAAWCPRAYSRSRSAIASGVSSSRPRASSRFSTSSSRDVEVDDGVEVQARRPGRACAGSRRARSRRGPASAGTTARVTSSSGARWPAAMCALTSRPSSVSRGDLVAQHVARGDVLHPELAREPHALRALPAARWGEHENSHPASVPGNKSRCGYPPAVWCGGPHCPGWPWPDDRRMSYRDRLPQLDGQLFLTDGGIETVLIFHEGLDLPAFAAFDLLKDDAGHRGAAPLLRAVRVAGRRARARLRRREPDLARLAALGGGDRLRRGRAGRLQPARDRADGGAARRATSGRARRS